MFNLPENNIHLSSQAKDKQQALELAAQALEKAGYVESGYLQGMLDREKQTSTFLGNGIAIPHGTLNTRTMVKNTGVQIFQYPQGVEWGDGNVAYVVIAIAARSDEHLALLRQLTHVLGDEDVAAKLASLQDRNKFRAILMGQQDFSVNAETISLNVDTQSLLTLVAINAGKLQEQGVVENSFVAEVVNQAAMPLGNGLWVTDSVVGNLKNAIAFSRANTCFENNHKSVQGVVTVSAVDEQINEHLSRLLDPQVQQVLLTGNVEQIIACLNNEAVVNQGNSEIVGEAVVGTFTIRNEHGLHARPSTLLVNEVKKFNAKITVENISRQTDAVSAKSLMKIVALGGTKGHRLRFVAIGEDAKQAIEAIGAVIEAGLGENVSQTAVQQPDTIEIINEKSKASEPLPSTNKECENSVEGVFTIRNEHGLHARPSAVLVNEVKKYNAIIMVKNLDRDTALISAKSLMKVVALGAVKGHRLQFVATGEQAQQAIEGIGAVIEQGLGE